MKIKINSIEGLIHLNRNEKLKANTLYLLSSESVANCRYFNSKKQIYYAHKLMQQKLTGILHIVDYQFTSKGWILLVRFKSTKSILSYYDRLKTYSRKKSKESNTPIAHVISEQIRTTISSIAKYVNKTSGRKGTLVAQVFLRYSIKSETVFKSIKNRLKRRELIFEKQRREFNNNTKWSKKMKIMLSESILCSNRRKQRKYKNQYLMQVADIEYIDRFVEHNL